MHPGGYGSQSPDPVQEPFHSTTPSTSFPITPGGAQLPSMPDRASPGQYIYAPDSWCGSEQSWQAETGSHYCY